ncbi:MAG: hypothetical protein ACLFV3_07160 [Phycisphaeraceae bacterium]
MSLTVLINLLAWVPFRDPMPLGPYWLWLLLPLALGISVAYKAVRVRDVDQLPRQAAVMTTQIIVFLGLIAGVVWLVALIG